MNYKSTDADESDRMIKTTSKFIELMNQRNYQNLNFTSIIPEDEHHRSIYPFAFTKGLQFIFD